jgi:hypothetical protein
MSHADDDRPNEPASEAPPAEPTEAPKNGDPAAPADPSSPPVSITEAQGDRPRRRRRRRRRKGPRPEGAAAPPLAGAGQGGDPPSTADAPVPNETAPSKAAPHQNDPGRMPRSRGRGGRGPREHRPPDARTREATPREATPREATPREERPREERPRDAAPREARAPGRGPRGKDGRERGPRGPKNQPYGKSRNAFERKPEPKLYSVETVVDRGFEDVTDEANDGAVRRVDWTIVKRTVADQRSTRLISAVYLLRRDGVDTEFTALGTARAAVNKTISHPEKLTRAKTEYAAAKKK